MVDADGDSARKSMEVGCHVIDDSHLPELPKGSIAGTLRSRSLTAGAFVSALPHR